MRRGLSRATPLFLTAVFLTLVVLAAAPGAASVEYRFEAVTANDPADVAAGERQLRLIVVESSTSAADVELYFSVEGESMGSPPPDPLSVTKILFVDPLLLIDAGGILDIELPFDDSVQFQRDPDPAGPANDFSFSAGGPKGAVYHGIQPGEAPYGLLLPLFDLEINGKAGLDLFLAALDRSP